MSERERQADIVFLQVSKHFFQRKRFEWETSESSAVDGNNQADRFEKQIEENSQTPVSGGMNDSAIHRVLNLGKMPILGARNKLAMHKVLNRKRCMSHNRIRNASQSIFVILGRFGWLLYVRFGFRPTIRFGKAF